MTIPGAGGQVPARPDQQVIPQPPIPVAPTAQRIFKTIVVAGPGQGIYTYSSTPPAAGTLIETAGISTPGTDKFGNHFLAGHSSYLGGFATSMQGGVINFYTGSLAGGWTFQGDLIISNLGEFIINFASNQIAGTLEVTGNVTLDSNLTINGTTITGSAVTSVGVPSATVDVHNGNVNLNMARPPNYAAVVAGTATAAQVEACLGGLLTSLTNRQLMA